VAPGSSPDAPAGALLAVGLAAATAHLAAALRSGSALAGRGQLSHDDLVISGTLTWTSKISGGSSAVPVLGAVGPMTSTLARGTGALALYRRQGRAADCPEGGHELTLGGDAHEDETAFLGPGTRP
jgi:hypothetical protein